MDNFNIARTKTMGSGFNYVGWFNDLVMSVDIERVDGNTRFTATATDVGTNDDPRWEQSTEIVWSYRPLTGEDMRRIAGDVAWLAADTHRKTWGE